MLEYVTSESVGDVELILKIYHSLSPDLRKARSIMWKRHRQIVRHISCIPSILPHFIMRILTHTSLAQLPKTPHSQFALVAVALADRWLALQKLVRH